MNRFTKVSSESDRYSVGEQCLSGRVLDSRPKAASSCLNGITALCP